MDPALGVDALLPHQMAERAEELGAYKARTKWFNLVVLAGLGGAFIGLGALFAMAVTVGLGPEPGGLARLVGGIAFSLAFVLVVIGGAELFTSNNLMVMALVSGRITAGELLRAWGLVYLGNLAGTIATAAIAVLAGLTVEANGALGEKATRTAVAMAELGPVESVFRSILGNTLVCHAIWLTYSARTTTDRILCVLLPIGAFYTLQLEHVIATMFYFPLAYFVTLTGESTLAAPGVVDFGTHLVAVTVGNVIGGGVLVGAVYWFVYLRKGT
jgi:formate/nitrite transporter